MIIENGTFSWTKEEEPSLTDLNFRVKEGSLVAVVGQVGSGKSSLLAALLGEMVKWSGRVNVKVIFLAYDFCIKKVITSKVAVFKHLCNSYYYLCNSYIAPIYIYKLFKR